MIAHTENLDDFGELVGQAVEAELEVRGKSQLRVFLRQERFTSVPEVKIVTEHGTRSFEVEFTHENTSMTLEAMRVRVSPELDRILAP